MMKKLMLLTLLVLMLSGVACRRAPETSAPATATPAGAGNGETIAAAGLPVLADGWTKIEPGGETRCAHDSDYAFWVRPGSVNKLLFYFQGGGGCWSAETCAVGSSFYDSSVTDADSPAGRDGIFDLENPANPFKDYYMVYAPACTGDIYMGTKETTYSSADGDDIVIQHKGSINGQAATRWIYENFAAPDSVFVTGCSAGSIGAAMFAPWMMEQYPTAQVTQLGDSLGFLFATPTPVDILYGATDGFAPWIPELQFLGESFTMAEYYRIVATTYPEATFSQYNALSDGVQRLFYAAGGGPPGQFESVLTDAIAAIHADRPNFSSYTADGAEHCILPRDTFYTREQDGQPFLAWITDLAAGNRPANVGCDEC